jgi:predicted metal-dependent enzyme (double-stranded beta helix superfamily)
MRNVTLVASLLLLAAANASAQQTYPNVEGQLLMEDERVIVQRFVLEPGQWEGIHAHPEYQLVLVVQSTDEVTMRFGDKETIFSGENQGMSAFWRPGPVAISEQHESGNTGSSPLEWIAISFKKDSIATDSPPRVVPRRSDR